jgi:phage-related protein
VKVIRFHPKVIRELDDLDLGLRAHLAELLAMLSEGQNLGMPVSRPMPIVEHGAHELRIKDRTGAYRVFYFTKQAGAILVFHLFKKKTQESPQKEIETAKRRLMEMRK